MYNRQWLDKILQASLTTSAQQRANLRHKVPEKQKSSILTPSSLGCGRPREIRELFQVLHDAHSEWTQDKRVK